MVTNGIFHPLKTFGRKFESSRKQPREKPICPGHQKSKKRLLKKGKKLIFCIEKKTTTSYSMLLLLVLGVCVGGPEGFFVFCHKINKVVAFSLMRLLRPTPPTAPVPLICCQSNIEHIHITHDIF